MYAVQNMYSYNLKFYMSFSNLLCKKNFIFRFGDFISLENRGSRTFLALSDSTGYLTGAVTKPLVTGSTYRSTSTFVPLNVPFDKLLKVYLTSLNGIKLNHFSVSLLNLASLKLR